MHPCIRAPGVTPTTDNRVPREGARTCTRHSSSRAAGWRIPGMAYEPKRSTRRPPPRSPLGPNYQPSLDNGHSLWCTRSPPASPHQPVC
eukprot:57179-Chlamydomonas_euryale.AAC.2